MNIVQITQPVFEDLAEREVDIVVCASGYETRSSYLAAKLAKLRGRRVVIGFSELQQGGARAANDELYEKLNFERFEVSGNSSAQAEVLLQDLMSSIDKQTCNVVIDISSMTRAWYGGFIRTFWTEDKFEKIITNFIYVPSVFPTEFNQYPPNEVVAPVEGFCSLNLTDKPTALIVGLGNDPGRAIGIREELDPNLTVAFYADPASDIRYYEKTLEANSDLLEKIDPSLRIAYPVRDTTATFSLLESVCNGLLRNYRVVLTSLGPKIFGLICFLIATRYPELSVWRVSAGSRTNVVDHKPDHLVINIESTWI